MDTSSRATQGAHDHDDGTAPGPARVGFAIGEENTPAAVQTAAANALVHVQTIEPAAAAGARAGTRTDTRTGTRTSTGIDSELFLEPAFRHCTDLGCTVIYILLLGWIGLILYTTIHFGNINPLWYGADSWGNVCGLDNRGRLHSDAGAGAGAVGAAGVLTNVGLDLRGRSHLHYFDMDDPRTPQRGGSQPLRVCVKQCPARAGNATVASQQGLCICSGAPTAATAATPSRSHPYVCDPAELLSGANRSISRLPATLGCPLKVKATAVVAHRCYPLRDAHTDDRWHLFLHDLTVAWFEFVVALGVVIVLGTLLMVLLCASAEAFTMVAVTLPVIGLIAVACIGIKQQGSLPSYQLEDSTHFAAENTWVNKWAYFYIYVVAFVLAGVCGIITLSFVRRLEDCWPFLFEAESFLRRNYGAIVLAAGSSILYAGVLALASDSHIITESRFRGFKMTRHHNHDLILFSEGPQPPAPKAVETTSCTRRL